MGFFIVVLVILSPVAIGLFYGFSLGARALAKSWGQSGEYAATLRFLGLNLCEPLINSVIVTSLVMQSGSRPLALLLSTAPMAVLLIPAAGLRFNDPFYRDQSKQILKRGLYRWGTNLVIFLGAFGHPLLVCISILMVVFGVILLWIHISAGKEQLYNALAGPPFAQPPIAPATLPRPRRSSPRHWTLRRPSAARCARRQPRLRPRRARPAGWSSAAACRSRSSRSGATRCCARSAPVG